MKHLDLATLETSGFYLIEASAGTGKTWTISALYILLLLESRMRPEEILVVTYTKSATAELRDRIRTRINDTLDLFKSGRPPRDSLEENLVTSRATDAETSIKLLTRALYSFDDAAIFTIHGFCQRALLEHAFESGSLFDTEMISDQTAILQDICDDYWRSGIMTESDSFLKFLTREGFTPSKLAEPFKGHYQNPDLVIIPSTIDPDLEADCLNCTSLAQQVAHLWRQDREGFIQQIIQSNLSQTSYKPTQIESASCGLDIWIASGSHTVACPGLKLFTTAALLAGQKKGSSMPDHPFFELCQQLFNALEQLDNSFRDKLICHQTALLNWVSRELTARKRSLNLRCYDDLLLDLYRALTAADGERLAGNLRQRYHAALIDEFQDTDPLQWQIFQRLGDQEGYPLYLIGDPKQAIYSFRGADIFAYAAASNCVEVSNKATLHTNRRSTEDLVQAVNALFQSSPDPFLSHSIRFSPVDSGRNTEHQLLKTGQVISNPLTFWVYQREDQNRAARKQEASSAIVTTVAAEISRLLDGTHEIIDKRGRRPLSAGDIAILVKAHYQSDLVQDALRVLAIPSVQRGSATIFESIEALDLLRIMRAIHEPFREQLVREALLTTSMGVSANQVAGFMVADDYDSQWDLWMKRFRSLHETARTSGIIATLESLLDECGLRSTSLARSGVERALTNILQCVELLHAAEQEHAGSLESLILWLEQQIASGSDDDNALLRLETDENAVQISTIHASKGLEYPVVFLPFAWDASSSRGRQTLFHDNEGRLTVDLGSKELEEHKELAQQERDAEAARLLYVALTRAEFLCYVAWGSISDAHASPLFRLLHGSTITDGKKFKTCPDQEILNDIISCSGPSNCLTAEFMPLDQPHVPYNPVSTGSQELNCRSLKKPIDTDWRVSSFSSMAAGSERIAQPRDHDAVVGPQPATDEPTSPRDGWSMFDFPRGAAAGTCLHTIFEKLDYSQLEPASTSHIARNCLLSSGYQEQWLPSVTRMVTAVTTAPLIADSTFSLSNMKTGSWNCEMEFYLPLANLTPVRLQNLFSGVLNHSQHGTFNETLTSLNFRQTRGMLHGFMDMIFVHDGRYYIVDWKSNHLGSTFQNYMHANLASSMADHAYILQYHLYTLALDRHLRQRLPGYDYEKHFGGALYIYLRGVSNESAECGFYRDKPTAEFIGRANDLLLGS
jgi:exodeoxyribonuclease V beta subunit